ncbi:CHAT domain-containing protein [Crucibulum laeve]|uniref:CHAT domain-containing protein n=1 Tax=Crucibulum laeve TaxID=68775 RepID=A0A5C3M1D4_9AGAR|nr:CHAT domain-containing protein [Crucibulum laeve]
MQIFLNVQILVSFAKQQFGHFNQSGDVAFLDPAITALASVLTILSVDHPQKIPMLRNLSVALSVRYDKLHREEDLDGIIALHQQELKLTSSNKLDCLQSLLKAVNIRYDRLGKPADLDEQIIIHRKMLKFQTPNHPDRVSTLHSLALHLQSRYEQRNQSIDLAESISLHQQALRWLSTLHSHRSSTLNSLGVVLLMRFHASSDDKDLEEAIVAHRDALQILSSTHPNRAIALRNLGNALAVRFRLYSQRENIQEAIDLHEEALDLTPVPHPDRYSSLQSLARTKELLFSELDDFEALDTSITLQRESLELLPRLHPEQSECLDSLGTSMGKRYWHSSRESDLSEAISLHRQAVELRPPPHPERPASLINLGISLSTRFDKFGQLEDLEQAISTHQSALDLLDGSSKDVPFVLNSLANDLIKRFEQSSVYDDLDQAIIYHRQALAMRPLPHPDRTISLTNLATSLRMRHEHGGDSKYLVESISLHRETVELLPLLHPSLASALSSLANGLSERFDQFGDRKDLDEAILLQRRALDLRSISTSHAGFPSLLNNLARVLHTRYERFSQGQDLDEVIDLHEQALELRPAPNSDRPSSLHNLGIALKDRFHLTHELQDISKAVACHREAIKLQGATHSARASSFTSLGNVLGFRFTLLASEEDLTEAINSHRKALELMPTNNSFYPHRIFNLAGILFTRYKHSNRQEDIDEAIKLYRGSVKLMPPGHPDVCGMYSDLARALVVAHSCAETPDMSLLEEAVAVYRAALGTVSAPTFRRFYAASAWARYVEGKHDSALEAYQIAISLLPALGELDLGLVSRQHALMARIRSDGLACDAASCAISFGQFRKAVELVEAGRAVFWSQILKLRSPITELEVQSPELAARLRRTAASLEQGSYRDISTPVETSSQKIKLSMEREAAQFLLLSDKWKSIVDDVQQLPGFKKFLKPYRFSDLEKAAADIPIVVLTANKLGSAALVMNETDVQHIALPDINLHDLKRLIKRLGKATRGRNIRFPSDPKITPPEPHVQPPAFRRAGRLAETPQIVDQDLIIKNILASLWIAIVEPIVRLLKLKKSMSPKRLRWCPTGPFTFLPIHAAGRYDDGDTECTSDYMISSYIPTISAVLPRQNVRAAPDFKMLAVIDKETLSHTAAELENIQRHVPNDCLVAFGTSGAPAQVADVLSHLSTVSVAHFACHGIQIPDLPLDSSLLLHDRNLKISEIIQQPMPNASLAFLSACETAKGDEEVPDEVLHLGSTLLFAGFSEVVATMWNISDQDGPDVADAFYGHIFQNGSGMSPNPNISRAAEALHLAVAKLRRKQIPFSRWIPFIHIG